ARVQGGLPVHRHTEPGATSATRPDGDGRAAPKAVPRQGRKHVAVTATEVVPPKPQVFLVSAHATVWYLSCRSATGPDKGLATVVVMNTYDRAPDCKAARTGIV